MTEPRPFQIAIRDEVLDDLARRLAAVRLPPRQSVPDGRPGDPAGEDDDMIERIAELVAYLARRHPTRRWIADLFHLLMAEQMGYESYVAHGDDIGGKVISWLGVRNPPARGAPSIRRLRRAQPCRASTLGALVICRSG